MLIIALIVVCIALYVVHKKEKERKRLINRDRATCIAKYRLNTKEEGHERRK